MLKEAQFGVLENNKEDDYNYRTKVAIAKLKAIIQFYLDSKEILRKTL